MFEKHPCYEGSGRGPEMAQEGGGARAPLLLGGGRQTDATRDGADKVL